MFTKTKLMNHFIHNHSVAFKVERFTFSPRQDSPFHTPFLFTQTCLTRPKASNDLVTDK